LQCRQRHGDDPVPRGCSGSPHFIGHDYCYDPYRKIPVADKGNPSAHCNCLKECEGDCDYDDDCVGYLVCGQRQGWSQGVPNGCSGTPHYVNHDYCYDPLAPAQVVSGPLEVSMPIDWSVWYQMHRNEVMFLLGAMLVVLCGVNVGVVFSKKQQRRYVMVKSIDSDTECGVDVESVPINQ